MEKIFSYKNCFFKPHLYKTAERYSVKTISLDLPNQILIVFANSKTEELFYFQKDISIYLSNSAL